MLRRSDASVAAGACAALLITTSVIAADDGRGVAPSGRAERTRSEPPSKALDLRLGDPARYLTPEQLRIALGGTDQPLESVEIEIRAPRGVRESPLQAPIPFGFAAIAWGIRNPSEAWRLFLPVLG
jgi:hypothetical protein